MNKGNQKIRTLGRTATVLLAIALLLSVCLPALGISAEGAATEWTVEQGEKAFHRLPEGIQVETVEVTPEDGGLKVSVEGNEVLLDATDARAGTYQARLFCTDGSVIDQPVTVSPQTAALQIADEDAEQPAPPTAETLPEITEAAAPETTAAAETEETEAPSETAAPTEPDETEAPPETVAETEPDATEESQPETEPLDMQAELEKLLLENALLDPLAAGDPDLILEQGQSGYYTSSDDEQITHIYSYGLPAGMTAQASGDVIHVTTTEDTPPGDYTVYYRQDGKTRSFVVRVTPKETGGGGGTGTGPITETKTLTYEKTVTDHGNGTFALELTVSGAVGSQTDRAKVDVIFIVDNSNSMYNERYMPGTKNAMKALVNNLDGNENIDARYSMVLYGTYAGIESGYTDASSIRSAIDGIQQYSPDSNGGTNYAAGIYYGKQLINSKRPDAMTVVIFLTDGAPTYRGGYPGGGNLDGNGSGDRGGYNIQAAINEIRGMNCNYFYGIGLGNSYANNLNRLVSNVQAPVTGVYNANNTTEITNAFNEIAGSVTTFLCENVTVTDYLSVSDTGERMLRVTDPASVAVTVTRTDGTTVAGPAASVTLPATDRNGAATLSTAYNASTGELVLHFPDTYQLEPDYVYKLSATIEPTEAAYEQYRADGGYTHTGDPNTGTYAGQPGIPTNERADVTYTYQGADGSAQYPLPVVPLNLGRLTVTKTFAGLTEEQIAEAANTLQFQVTLDPSGRSAVISLADMTLLDGVYAYTFDMLSPGTRYTVSETGGAVDGYQLSVLVNGEDGTTAQGTVPGGGTQTAAYENIYTLANTSITVSKSVEGNMGDLEKQFRFTMELDRPISPKPTAGGDYTVSEDGMTVTFTLRGGQSVTIANVPIGASMTLTESGVSDYGVWMNGDPVKTEAETVGTAEKTFIIEKDLEIQVVNRHDADIDTGMTADTTPYVIFLWLAVLGAGMLLARVRRDTEA